MSALCIKIKANLTFKWGLTAVVIIVLCRGLNPRNKRNMNIFGYREDLNYFSMIWFWLFTCDQYDQIWRNFTTLAKFKSIWQMFECLFSIWQNFGPTLVNVLFCWANFHCCKQPKLNKPSRHLVTLFSYLSLISKPDLLSFSLQWKSKYWTKNPTNRLNEPISNR